MLEEAEAPFVNLASLAVEAEDEDFATCLCPFLCLCGEFRSLFVVMLAIGRHLDTHDDVLHDGKPKSWQNLLSTALAAIGILLVGHTTPSANPTCIA